MGLLDLLLICLWAAAGVWAFLSGSDSLYKLFLGLIIGFLSYLVISYQIELSTYQSPAMLDGYERFIREHSVGILSLALLNIPAMGLFFMFHPRISILSRSRSISNILLWLLLPIFLIGILSFLSSNSLLSDSLAWNKIFDFFASSMLYEVFQKLPWGIFLLLWFLIFYKSIFLLVWAFLLWLWKEVIMLYFRDWKKRQKESQTRQEEPEND